MLHNCYGINKVKNTETDSGEKIDEKQLWSDVKFEQELLSNKVATCIFKPVKTGIYLSSF